MRFFLFFFFSLNAHSMRRPVARGGGGNMQLVNPSGNERNTDRRCVRRCRVTPTAMRESEERVSMGMMTTETCARENGCGCALPPSLKC